MKKQPELSELSLEELEKIAKMNKFSSIILIIAIGIQFLVGVFLTFRNGFNVFIILPMAFLPLIIVNFTNLNKIKDEIAKRKS
jgi:hypothetical protein